ncbi:Phage capsid scaffolding protein (GPO) serine peptidase [Quillaja saponaria]|uniref:Phage capsid scaffolding protein (GPO) serine peptidase n=1 Tax=Quillaja saponaria TaxID=32244 RepID=A0AAD7PSF3_QUISA|nr:Phage capsid scaffolding protein (GPO) serine peptidase [Quillaja saponaria]
MSTTTTTFLSKSSCYVTAEICGRYQGSNPKLIHLPVMSKLKDNSILLQNQSWGCGFRLQNDYKRKMDLIVYSSAKPGPPPPNSVPSPASWKAWLFGFIMTIVIPFSKNKWAPLITLKEKVETVIDMAEDVTEIVEKVADEVDKVAEEIADHLPEGKLQKTFRFIEKAAEETSKGADLAEEVIDKLEKVEQEVESFFEGAPDEVKNKISRESKDHK